MFPLVSVSTECTGTMESISSEFCGKVNAGHRKLKTGADLNHSSAPELIISTSPCATLRYGNYSAAAGSRSVSVTPEMHKKQIS